MTQIGNMAQGASHLSGGPAGLATALSPARERQGLAVFGQAVSEDALTQPKAAERRLDLQSAETVIERLNGQLQQERRTVQFSLDQDAGRIVIKITDTETDQLIRQIPPERTLEILRDLAEGRSETEQTGLFLDEIV